MAKAREHYEISLAEVSGKLVNDVYGYASKATGEPCFKITRIMFTDGTDLAVEGEHDFPYLPDYQQILRLPSPPESLWPS